MGENQVSATRPSPSGEAWRVITSAFITGCMVDCILYCSGTGRPIRLHWLSYSRQLYGSGRGYRREMSGWFGWPFTFFFGIAAVIVPSLMPFPSFFNLIVKMSLFWGVSTERNVRVGGNKNILKAQLHELASEFLKGLTKSNPATW